MSNSKTFDIVLTGVGGQGIVMLSNALGNSCAEGGITVKTGELHGLSQRSGTVYIHLRMGDKGLSPLIPYGEADAILAMEAIEALRYIEFLKDDGVMIINKHIMHPTNEIAQLSKEKRTDFIQLESIIEQLKTVTSNIAVIDALDLANQAGNPLTENAVLLGALSTLADLPPSMDDMKKGLGKVVPQKALEQNLEAFKLGCKNAYDSLCEHVSCREP
jgi:indolepyruvate ferredoxin oxidoreductase beta subunit